MLSIVCLTIFSGCAPRVIYRDSPPIIKPCPIEIPEKLYKKDLCNRQTFKSNSNSEYVAMQTCAEVKFDALQLDYNNALKAIDMCIGVDK